MRSEALQGLFSAFRAAPVGYGTLVLHDYDGSITKELIEWAGRHSLAIETARLAHDASRDDAYSWTVTKCLGISVHDATSRTPLERESSNDPSAAPSE
jgi:hypothetical protein